MHGGLVATRVFSQLPQVGVLARILSINGDCPDGHIDFFEILPSSGDLMEDTV